MHEVIREGFRNRLGSEVTIEIEHMNEIPAEASGKFRYVMSHVDISSRGETGYH
jgi:phenylacetate-CoA ligase